MPRKKKTEEVVEEKPKKIRWYDVNDIYKLGADITIAFGGRSNGKTYSAINIALKEFKDYGTTFCYLRRWMEDVNTFACSTLIKQEQVDKIFGEDYEVTYRNHTFTLVHHIVNEAGKNIAEKQIIGFAVAISEAKHRKGTNFPNTHLVIFDEFIDMNGEITLANEYNKYENIISTIKRTNKIRIILLSNPTSKYSEYFTKLGVNPDKIEQGEIKEYLHPNGKSKVVVQWTPFIEEIAELAGELTNSKMISEGAWEIPPTDEIPSEEEERISEQLLCTMYEPMVDATLGVYLRYGVWNSYETDKFGLVKPIQHEREFLVIRRIDNGRKSSYFHLTNQKSLCNTYYHKLDTMLRDIIDMCDIDIKRELEMGRVYCDTMYSGDIFNNCWQYYSIVKVRTLL